MKHGKDKEDLNETREQNSAKRSRRMKEQEGTEELIPRNEEDARGTQEVNRVVRYQEVRLAQHAREDYEERQGEDDSEDWGTLTDETPWIII